MTIPTASMTPTSPTDAKMFRFSRREMERRWALVRAHLDEQDLDALIVQGYEDKVGGAVKWFTDVPAGYPKTVIFHRDDLMSVVESGANGVRRSSDGGDPDLPGVGEVVTTWAFQTAHYTAGMNASVVAEIVTSRGYRRVGIAGATLMPHGFILGLQAGLAGVELVDATEFLDHARAVKGPEEITQLRSIAATQDAVFAKLLNFIQPGMRDFEVNAFLDYQLQLLGAERGTYLGKSAPFGRPAPFGYRHFQGRTINRGDYVALLVESNGYGGLWTEVARTICFGPAPAELQEGFEICVQAQAQVASQCRPGAQPADIARAHNEFMREAGGVPELRLLGHGQGYDMVERPLLRQDETMTLQAGMNLAIHPTHPTASMLGHICDNYLIDLDGTGAFLHSSAKQLFEL